MLAKPNNAKKSASTFLFFSFFFSASTIGKSQVGTRLLSPFTIPSCLALDIVGETSG